MIDGHASQDEEVRRLRRLVKELIEDHDRLSREVRELKKQIASSPSPIVAAVAEDMHSLQVCESPVEPAPPSTGGTAAPDKLDLNLFRSLFLGRQDVYARLWRSAKGSSGYSPACNNEWVEGLCRKREVRCADCENRDFAELTDQVLLDHLGGKQVVGVYPLLPAGDCHFLAVDFDGAGWQSDVSAFVAACERGGVASAIERSRSGKGAHVWVFFEEVVAAAQARKLGSLLLTDAMSHRYEISMKTYDRFFPNQDTMPKGGFGNLIALPLQKAALESCNTCFLAADFNPLPDQWSFLASISKVSRTRLEDLVKTAGKQGKVFGACSRFAEDDDKPWLSVPSKRFQPPLLTKPLPDHVNAVLGNCVYVEKEGLSPSLLDHIRRLATFQNPEFYKKQSLRLSTALTPRMICCAENFPAHLGIPRGCLGELENLLENAGIALELTDERFAERKIEARFNGELNIRQELAVQDLLEHDNGVLVAPPGTGKTVIGMMLIAKRCVNTLVLVHRRPLMEQWQERLSTFLDFPVGTVGIIGGGQNKPTGLVDIGMLQSLVRKGNVKDLATEYGMVIVDECQHIPAVSFESVMREAKSKYVYGLTATPYRRDGHHPIVFMQCGPVRHVFDSKGGETPDRAFEKCLIVKETDFRLSGESTIQEVYAALVSDPARNRMIADDLIACVHSGRSPILLTARRAHLETLANMLENEIEELVVMHGGLTVKQRRVAMERLASIPAERERAIVATGSFIGEGFDEARLDTLFLAMPVSFKSIIVQYSGRLLRPYPGKTDVQVYDYLDRNVAMLGRMFERRRIGYRSIGYE